MSTLAPVAALLAPFCNCSGRGVWKPSAMCLRSAATLPTSLKRMTGPLGESPSIPIPACLAQTLVTRQG